MSCPVQCKTAQSVEWRHKKHHEEFNVMLLFNMILVISWDDKRLLAHSIFKFNPSFCSICLFLANWWMDWLKTDDSRIFAIIFSNICVKRKKSCPLYKCPELQWEHYEGTSKLLLLLVSKAFWLLCLWSEGMLPPEREFEIHM